MEDLALPELYRKVRKAAAPLLVLLILCLLAASTGISWADTTTDGGLPIQQIPRDPWFFTVAAASAAGWILGAVRGFSTSADWLKKYLKNPPIALVFMADLLVFVVVGAFLGTGIYTPKTFVAAIAAGLTWPIGVGALVTSART